MTPIQLKEFIYENDKIEYILGELGCHGVKESQKEYRAGLPNHTNKTAISVKKNEFLNVKIYQPDDEIIKGDIFTLAMTIKDLTFPQSNKLVHDILGIPYVYTQNTTQNTTKTPLDIFKKAKGKRRTQVDVSELDLYDFDTDFEYQQGLYFEWFREGILPHTASVFGLGFDSKSKRILIPHRLYCSTDDKFVGLVGRTTIENFELFDIPKYFPLIPYLKSLNLYGLQENYKHIQEAGYVVVHEAEKSVLKRHSRLDKTGVAVCSHDISDEQVKILIGLDVEIIIAYDKGVKLEHIWSQCDRFYGVRKVSYIWDEFNVLKGKDAPADALDKVYKFLFNRRVKYDEECHLKYMKYLEVKDGGKKNRAISSTA